MTLVRLTSRLSVNPDHVASVGWDEPGYGRGSRLVITMADGTEHKLEHDPHRMDGLDCYKVESALLGEGTA